MTVRTRFAPSPTGQVHIGNIRAAIYNWLFARHHGGQFLLRVEDTDRERSTPEAVKTVLDSMEWLGLNFDEPALYQTTQKEKHLAAAEDLLRRGLAYKFDKGGTGKEAVLFKMPGENMEFTDLIKGTMRKEAKDMQDFVIVRSDGNPVFHLGNVIDDVTMSVTHVIRGDDHVENTFRHIALFRAIGAAIPQYAHLPMIVNAQGKPYSKRDGAAFVGDFREQGYEAAALFNYLTLIGWSPGGDREMMTRDEMVQLFTLDRVQSKAGQFDLKKFQKMNVWYLQQAPDATWVQKFREIFPQADAEMLAKVIPLMKPRVRNWKEIPSAIYFFSEDFPVDAVAKEKVLGAQAAKDLAVAARDALAALATFDAPSIEAALCSVADSRGLKHVDVKQPVRVAVTGVAGGPDLAQSLAILGRERSLSRIGRAL